MEGGTGCSGRLPAGPTSSANCQASCGCACGTTVSAESQGPAEIFGAAAGGLHEQQCGPSSASCTSCTPSTSCPCGCSSCSCCTCCRCSASRRSATYSISHQNAAAEADQDQQLKEINSIFSAAEAALQAFWRSSIARAGLISSGDQNGSQVKTAARSQAAASIAWVLAAASVVLKEDTDEEDDVDHMFGGAGSINGHGGSGTDFHHGGGFYQYHRRHSGSEYDGRDLIRRADVQLSRSSVHGTPASFYSHMHSTSAPTTRSIPRWEWRPVIRRPFTPPSAPYSPASAAPTNVPNIPNSMTSSCMSSRVPGASDVLEGPASDQHLNHNIGASSISISSLLPPLISCRITDKPYNEETPRPLGASNASSTATARSDWPFQEVEQDSKLDQPKKPNILGGHQAWCTPLDRSEKSIAIDIIDSHQQQLVSQTLVEPLTRNENNNEEEEEDGHEKSLLLLHLTNDTGSCIKETHQGSAIISTDADTSKYDSSEVMSASPGGKNYKKHLKKKQRKASISTQV